jgi:uncharacterized membrane protein YfcA
LIGAGGGFILAPILLLLYPKENPETITSISLAVVFFNALSGSIAYARLGRIDYRSGIIFSIATIPGAILGAVTTAYLSRRLFDAVFGSLMIAAAVPLLLRPSKRTTARSGLAHQEPTGAAGAVRGSSRPFSYNPYLGVGISVLVGYVSSLLGVGGGFIHVPALVHFLDFPVHVATATSHFILAVMAFTGTVVHVVTGAFAHGVRRTVVLSLGVLVGAQIGARLSDRVHGDWIMRSLAVVLVFVGIRLILTSLGL